MALTAGQAPAVEAGPLVIGSCHEQPLSGGEGAILDRLTREAFARAGQTVEIVHLPCERSLAAANEGWIDGDILRVDGISALYPNLVRVGERTVDVEFAAFALGPGTEPAGLEDLGPFHVGYVTGWKILERDVRASSLTTVSDPKSLFSMLGAGRIDIAIYERLTGEAVARQLGVQAVAAPKPLLVMPQYLYLNRRHADLAASLAEALRSMKRDGTYSGLPMAAPLEGPADGSAGVAP